MTRTPAAVVLLLAALAGWSFYAPDHPATAPPLDPPRLPSAASRSKPEGAPDNEAPVEDLPTMPVGTIELPEQLDRRQLEAGMEKARKHVERCRAVEPFTGTLTVRVTIAKNGNVQSVALLPPPETIDKTPFGECVKKALKLRGSFPRFRGTVLPTIELQYPYLFGPD